LNNALNVAKQLAHIDGECGIKEISSSRDLMEVMKNGLTPYIKTQNELPLIDESINRLKAVISMSGKVQAITPIVLNIH
ncbi:MAG: hypothetical protein IKT28_04655, partial [Rikenellaceae bacterium]|nr:hypothetical protein [Rikenellaceae bacterium]